MNLHDRFTEKNEFEYSYIRCTRCGKILSKQDKFCPYCEGVQGFREKKEEEI